MTFDCYTQDLELAYQDCLFDVAHDMIDMDVPPELMPLTLAIKAARMGGITADYL